MWVWHPRCSLGMGWHKYVSEQLEGERISLTRCHHYYGRMQTKNWNQHQEYSWLNLHEKTPHSCSWEHLQVSSKGFLAAALWKMERPVKWATVSNVNYWAKNQSNGKIFKYSRVHEQHGKHFSDFSRAGTETTYIIPGSSCALVNNCVLVVGLSRWGTLVYSQGH